MSGGPELARDGRLARVARAFGAEIRRRWHARPLVVLVGGGATLAYLLRLVLLGLLRL
jgi:hypothetical protein